MSKQPTKPADPKARRRSSPPALPSKEDIQNFIRNAKGRVGKREIARHFGLLPAQKNALNKLIGDLAGTGTIAPAGKKRFTRQAPRATDGMLPDTAIVEITGTDPHGDPIAKPVEWTGVGRPPIIFMHPEKRGAAALARGERVLAKLRPVGHSGDKYEGRTLKRIEGATGRILGILRNDRIEPVDKREKAAWRVPPGETGGAQDGDLVLAEALPQTGYGLRPARVIERLGNMGEPKSVSLLCIHMHGIPDAFAPDVLAEADAATGVGPAGREDLRATPLVTIDGDDARDFDDAVFAEPTEDGWRLIVAIADVAHYVRPHAPLDVSAFERGNSVYFPDRVVPMLPEALSNGWCSLRPNEDRGCLFTEMLIDAQGNKLRHRFGRGLMRSFARLTYEQVQIAADRKEDLPDVPKGQIDHLYGAFRALLAARTRRGTLDLDLPERRVLLDDAGNVAGVVPRARLDSHKLIEEFMVLANVAAAEELERLHQPCMYRVHDRPTPEKMQALREFLSGMDISLPAGDQLHPRDLEGVLLKVADTEHAQLVSEVMLRSMAQAQYSPENIGHFGLALPHYAHFTSPIRRYSDLLVHRALVRGLHLGKDGLTADEAGRFPDIAAHISGTERRAALAERDATDRYLALFMADKVGAQFTARISGVTRFGLFVTLDGSGASGLVPVTTLPDDFWIHDEAAQALIGRRTRRIFKLAQPVTVLLTEATPATGGLTFNIIDSSVRAKRRK